MRDFLEDILYPILIFFVSIGILMGILFSVVTLITKNIYCPQLGEALELSTKYDFWAGGCFVEMSDGNWIRTTNYSGVNIADN